MRTKKGPKSDLTGQSFGFLYVTGMETMPHDKRREYKAICKCLNCGKENHSVFPYHLKKGLAKSCGCLIGYRKTGKERKNYRGYEDIRGVTWGRIQEGAKRRNLSFNISIEYAWDLYIKQNKKCALTGIEIILSDKPKFSNTASLDRINPDLGYIEGNVQWVHRNVNIIKHCCSEQYFVTICRLVSQNENLKNINSLNLNEIAESRLFLSVDD